MGKEDMKKITLNDLLAQKMNKENDTIAFKEIYIESLDGAMLFKKPDNDLILDTIDKIGENDTMKNCASAYRFLIYQTCEILHNKELQQQYSEEIVEPTDIVDKIFNLNDILQIGNELMEMAGFKDINKLKN